MPLQDTQTPPLNALFYKQQAMISLNEGDITTSLNYIDIAISLATDKSLYVFYKIKILYLAQLPIECSNLILRHLYFLYINCPLNQFAQILTFYEEVTNCTTDDLSRTLTLHNTPYILAYIYPDLIEDSNYNFHSRALDFKQHNEFLDCISCCDIALKFEPNSLSLLHLQAESYLLLEEYTKAIIIYKKIIMISSLTPDISYSLAKSYKSLGEFKEAINYLKIFLINNPVHLEALNLLGDCYMQLADYPKALHTFKQLLKLEPNEVSYSLKLGEIYTLLQRKLLARKYYRYANHLQQGHAFSSYTIEKLFKPKYWIISVLLLCVIQFYLFRVGILPSIVYDLEVKVDSLVIPVNGFTDYTINYKQFPPYAKAPNYTVISNNPDIANPIDGLSALNGFSAGSATFDVLLDSTKHTSFIIKVEEYLPIGITFQLAHTPLGVGNKTSIQWSISYQDNLQGTLTPHFISTDPTILKVSPTGDTVEALAPGKVTLIASCGEITESLNLEIKNTPN